MNLSLIFEDDQEEDIDRIISDAAKYEDDQEMKRIPEDEPLWFELPSRVRATESQWEVERDRVRQSKVWKGKQKRVRGLLTTLNSLSADLFAATSVAERQIALLHDLHSLFLTSCRTKIKDYEKGYPLRQNPLYKNIAPIPIFSANSEQTWQNTLDTIGEAV